MTADKKEVQRRCDELNNLQHQIVEMELDLNTLYMRYGIPRRVELTFTTTPKRSPKTAPFVDTCGYFEGF